jgi:hypothetical protein
MADIISLASSIIKFATDLKNAELLGKVADLTVAAAQIAEEKAQLIRENSELKEQNRVLLEDRENPLIFNKEDRLYYRPDDTEHSSPFCQRCYEVEHRRVHLKMNSVCPQCGQDFHTTSFEDILASV